MLRRQSLEKNRSGNGLRNKQIKKKKLKKFTKHLFMLAVFPGSELQKQQLLSFS